MENSFKAMNEVFKETLLSLQKYAEILEGASTEEKKNEAILAALDISLSATDIVGLLRDPERLNIVVKKLKMKAFW